MLLSAGDNYHAMGCYQFDNRYGLQDFLVACYNYSPTRYSMFAWLKGRKRGYLEHEALRLEQEGLNRHGEEAERFVVRRVPSEPRGILAPAGRLVLPGIRRVRAAPVQQQRAQLQYGQPKRLLKGLVSGICNLFGSGGMQFFVGGTLYGKHYNGAVSLAR